MSETIKSYRIRTNVGEDNYVSVNLEQDYDAFDILSLTINTNDMYRLHNSNYGVVVGRVLANNGFGIPNAKISIFIEADDTQREELAAIYSYTTTASANKDGVRYNLLPDNEVGDCHQVVGTFPNKRYVLDNEDIIEVFDKYFKYTTRTNNSGDYIICGVPKGLQTLHMDLDLSDCGILSQRPRDFVYKGYTIEQFENPNMFKTGTTLSSLSQLFTQDQNVNVQPFWGNDSLGETIGITRADINVDFKFEPTCVFLGCAVSDNSSNGITKKCMATPHMGDMDELTTGEGTIEMIRKTYAGKVESFQIKGTELIDGNGIWCYQIPMNLDYMTTDEYGNMVPTDNPDKGIPTRARVRFRVSLHDNEKNVDNFFRPKVLVPHNPQTVGGYDYEFGTNTDENSFRDLFWNNVYSVKSYVPRFQKRKVRGWKEDKFTGIKGCQYYGKNNPIPYNNIRIKLPFMFVVMCILIKAFIKLTGLLNGVLAFVGHALANLGITAIPRAGKDDFAADLVNAIVDWLNGGLFKPGIWPIYGWVLGFSLVVLEDGLCPDLENWYFAPVAEFGRDFMGKVGPHPYPEQYGGKYDILFQTYGKITTEDDPKSIDDQNQDSSDTGTCLTINSDYLISCIEMNLAQEYRVINFDFYNDWINGMIYLPRFMRYVRKKRTFLGITIAKEKVKGCMDDPKIFSKSRRYTQQCALDYSKRGMSGGRYIFTTLNSEQTKVDNNYRIVRSNNLHKKLGFGQAVIFGKNGGTVHEHKTIKDEYVYYLKPCEWNSNGEYANAKINLFATDLILLGSLNDCDDSGLPQAFTHLKGSTYIMPTNLALTNMEENGPLYTVDGQTLCGPRGTDIGRNTKSGQTMVVVTPNSSGPSLQRELNIFGKTGSPNDDTDYNDPSDTIALTEAAGIAWNFTGPGQGYIDKGKMYYPGGHFLGLSCVNSQTNVKTCLNLERMCEVGVTMSQRKEEISKIDDNGNTEIVYTVPTGFISMDEIVDRDFRSMFATMNKKPLIATKINQDTGYRMYDFDSVTPVNFGGEFSNFVGKNTPYNQNVYVWEESDYLSSFGVNLASGREDYDPFEGQHTRRRTIESSSLEYYAFRMGLNYKDLNISAAQIKKFAKTNGIDHMFLPQYENSFYFYFGLHDGATALDEFNKQFFSECESKTILTSDPEIEIIVGDFSVCELTSEVNFYVRNMNGPYSVKIDENVADTENSPSFSITLGRGKHTIIVTDSDNKEVSGDFEVGEDAYTYNVSKYEFNRTPQFNGPIVNWDVMGGQMAYNGGYILWDNVSVKGIDNSNGDRIRICFNMDDVEVPVSSGGTAIYYTKFVGLGVSWWLSYLCDDGQQHRSEILGTFVFSKNPGGKLSIGAGVPITFEQLYSLLGTGTTANWFNNNKDKFSGGTDYDANYKSNMAWPWSIRKSIVRTCFEKNTAFDTNISSTYNKIAWGNPQNNQSIRDDLFYSSESYDQIPAGLLVDDEYTFFDTTSGNRKKFYGASYNKDITTENIVGVSTGAGETVEGGIIKSYELVNNPTGMENGACLYKPIPDGRLIPGVFASSPAGRKIILWGDVQELSGYTIGVVYSAHEHPIITLPFTVNGKYLIRHSASAMSEDGVKNVSVDCHVRNGNRYNGYYSEDSYIDLKYAQNGNYAFKHNTSNLVESEVIYSGVSSSSWAKSTNGDKGLSYSIVEGYPKYKFSRTGGTLRAYGGTYCSEFSGASLYSPCAEKRSLDMKWNFYETVILIKYDNTHYAITGMTDTDSDVVYGLYNGVGSAFTLSEDIDTDEDIAYVHMYITSADSAHIGEVVNVRFKCRGGSTNFEYTYTDPDSEAVKHDEFSIRDKTISDVESYTDRFMTLHQKFKRLLTISADTQYMSACTVGQWEAGMTPYGQRRNVLVNFSGKYPMPFAKKTYSENYDMEQGSVLWVSDNPRIVDDIPFGPPVLKIGNVLDPSDITFSNNETICGVTIDFKLSHDDENAYRIVSSEEWLRFRAVGDTASEQTVYEKNVTSSNKKDNIELVCDENTGEERSAAVTIYYGDVLEKYYTITITQGN